MEMERRDYVIQFWKMVNQQWEESMDKTRLSAVGWMMGDYHVRFCESLGVRFPWLLD